METYRNLFGMIAMTLTLVIFCACPFMGGPQDDDDYVDDTTAPTTPTDLAVTVEKGIATLTWSEASDDSGVDGYYVYRDGEVIDDTSETSFNDETAPLWSTYEYAVSAFDWRENESEPSSPISVAVELQVGDVVGIWSGPMEVTNMSNYGDYGNLEFEISTDGSVSGEIFMTCYAPDPYNPGCYYQGSIQSTLSGEWEGQNLSLEIAQASDYPIDLNGGTVSLEFTAWNAAEGSYDADLDSNYFSSGTVEVEL